MTELREKFQCPHCFCSVSRPDPGQSAVNCPACRTALAINGYLCADCGTYHERSVPLCETCVAPMTQICRRCHAVNWAGNLHCQSCEADLDMIETLASRSTEGTTLFVQQQMRASSQIRAQEKKASAERMGQLLAQEAQRQEEIHRLATLQRERDRILWVGISLIIFLIVIITLTITFFI